MKIKKIPLTPLPKDKRMNLPKEDSFIVKNGKVILIEDLINKS